jgi:hypothetical protein
MTRRSWSVSGEDVTARPRRDGRRQGACFGQGGGAAMTRRSRSRARVRSAVAGRDVADAHGAGGRERGGPSYVYKCEIGGK